METIQVSTNIHCNKCVAKVTPLLDNNAAIHSWHVDTQSPDKTLTVTGNITPHGLSKLVEQAGFKVSQNTPDNTEKHCAMPHTPKQHRVAATDASDKFWHDTKVWKRASLNTFNCLVGCAIGDFGMIIYLQAYHPETPMWLTMLLAIIAGLITSIVLETFLLKINEKLTWMQSLSMALGMSLLSMIAMEIAMNITDFLLVGGKPDFHSHLYWIAFAVSAVVGFLAPLPYNYFKLKKYNKSCH